MSMVMEALMGKMCYPLILAVKMSSKKIKGAAHKSADFDCTCKR